jgi:A/G-specific adenine glycosylase
MELGATLCVPRSPECLICPVSAHCEAYRAGVQETIPPPKKTKENPLERRWTFVLRAGEKFLVEQRPPTGRWAGMWQFVTVPADDDTSPAVAVRRATGLSATTVKRIGHVAHALTHRRYEFDVYAADVTGRPSADRVWATPGEIDRLPLSKPQLKVAQLAQGLPPAQTNAPRARAAHRR